MSKCDVCKKANGKNVFPFKDRVLVLCGSCSHNVRESIGGIHDGIPELISKDIVIKSIATHLYENHKELLANVIGES